MFFELNSISITLAFPELVDTSLDLYDFSTIKKDMYNHVLKTQGTAHAGILRNTQSARGGKWVKLHQDREWTCNILGRDLHTNWMTPIQNVACPLFVTVFLQQLQSCPTDFALYSEKNTRLIEKRAFGLYNSFSLCPSKHAANLIDFIPSANKYTSSPGHYI